LPKGRLHGKPGVGFLKARKKYNEKKNEVKNKNKIIRNESRKTFLISLWRQ